MKPVMDKTSPAPSAAHVGTGSVRSHGWAVPLSESATAPDRAELEVWTRQSVRRGSRRVGEEMMRVMRSRWRAYTL